MEQNIEYVATELRRLKIGDFYRSRALSNEQRSWIDFLCQKYLQGSDKERKEVISLVEPNFSFVFFMFAKAMAVESIREYSEGKILSGLLALAIENCKFDSRDSTIVLSLVFHSAQKLSIDTTALFERVAELSAPDAANLFRNFVTRAVAERSIALFGYKEGEDPRGLFSYVPCE